MSGIASHFQSNGLSIQAWKPDIDPVAGTYDPTGSLINDDVAQITSTYTHVLEANDGYKSLALTLAINKDDFDDWIDKGLGRHIEVFSPELERIFAGFVNSVSAGFGSLMIKRGPLLDIVNRAGVIYVPIFDADEDPPIVGDTTITTLANNTDSQNLYGIIEKVINGGQLLDDGTTDDAEQIRDTFLAENALPETADPTLSLGGGDTVSITLEILGYIEFLKLYIYNSVTTGVTTYTAKIEAVLAADPNGIFSTDYTGIDTNASLANAYEDQERTAYNIITELLPQGDAAFNRWLFGVGSEQKVFYNAIPTTPFYEHSLTNPMDQISLYGGGTIVEPWNMRAGRWLFVTDYLIGRTFPTELRKDPRNVFIESITYTAPRGITLTGNKVNKLDQLIARKGTGGLTA